MKIRNLILALTVAADGRPLAVEGSITLLVAEEEAGGEPLWTETRSAVGADNWDAIGRAEVAMIAVRGGGLPCLRCPEISPRGS